MATIESIFEQFTSGVVSTIKTIGISDVLDILVTAYIIYHIIRLVRETRAVQLVKGIGAILVVAFFAQQFNMITLSYFLNNILTAGIFALVVLFQPELRRILEQLGRTNLSTVGRFSLSQFSGVQTQENVGKFIDIVCDSSAYLSSYKTGALMVIERKTKLGEIIKTGTTIDAITSVELVENIFFINSPLHDGAMIFREGRLYSAGCYLPLSQNMEIGRELGTRHRAGLGMSEVSDAIVVIVSEETGAISVAINGQLQRGLSKEQLFSLLTQEIIGANPEDAPTKKHLFWRNSK